MAPPDANTPRPRLIAPLLLCAGAAALAGLTVYRAVRTTDTRPPDHGLAAPADAAEAASRRQEFAGTFATGSRPGDRTLTLHADGRVDFAELGVAGPVTGDSTTFQLHRRDRKFSLVTGRAGVIDVVDLDTLTYWGDTYRRR